MTSKAFQKAQEIVAQFGCAGIVEGVKLALNIGDPGDPLTKVQARAVCTVALETMEWAKREKKVRVKRADEFPDVPELNIGDDVEIQSRGGKTWGKFAYRSAGKRIAIMAGPSLVKGYFVRKLTAEESAQVHVGRIE
jgi:hypothetical protein